MQYSSSSQLETAKCTRKDWRAKASEQQRETIKTSKTNHSLSVCCLHYSTPLRDAKDCAEISKFMCVHEEDEGLVYHHTITDSFPMVIHHEAEQ